MASVAQKLLHAPPTSGGPKAQHERMKHTVCPSLGRAGHGTQPSGRKDARSTPHHSPSCNARLFSSSQ